MKKRHFLFLPLIALATVGSVLVATPEPAEASHCFGTNFDCYTRTAYWEPIFYCADDGTDCLDCCLKRT